MDLDQLLNGIGISPLIASVQASDRSAVDDPQTLLKLAQASLNESVRVLRLQGVENIRVIKQATGAPVIGLIKKSYSDSDIYITPSPSEVEALIELGCEVIALDGTPRRRPHDEDLSSLIALIHSAGRLAMADCDNPDSVRYALKCGADIIGTTLAGYTSESWETQGPDLDFLREAVRLAGGTPVFAEGRYQEPWQVQAALRIGASGVVIGGVLNDPAKQTRRFLSAAKLPTDRIGAVDIGGTWLRFGVFDADWKLLDSERIPLPASQQDREAWIRSQAKAADVHRIGISTGGTVDPESKLVIEAKPIIPDYVGASYDWGDFSVAILNDGLATAWAHACHPQFAGMKVATLALGTGVGCGFVVNGRIWRGPYGEYPRLNDLAVGRESFEDLLGGAALTSNPTADQIERALSASRQAIQVLAALWFPDVIIVCGGVGLSDWMQEQVYNLNSGMPEGWLKPDVMPSPFGSEAGMYGAAALALYPEIA